MKSTDLELLRGAPPGHLYAIAEARRISLPGGRPPSAQRVPLEEIAARLFYGPSLRETLRGLPPHDWAILREVQRCGGQAPSYELRAYLITAGMIPSNTRTSDTQAALYEQALGQLLRLGLLFWGRVDTLGAREYASGAHDGLLVAPPSVLAVLATIEPLPDEPSSAAVKPRAPVFASAETLQRDLYFYWRLVSDQPGGLGLMGNGLVSKAALRSLNAVLSLRSEIDTVRSEQDAGRLFFLRLLAQALGLLVARNEVVYAAAGPAFFAASVAERTQRAFDAWLTGTFWNELLHVPGLTLRPPPVPLEPARPELRGVRQAALALLGEYPADAWLSRAMVLAGARLRRPDLLFHHRRGQADVYTAAGNPFGLDFRPRGGWLSPHDAWLRVEGALLAALIEGPLHWLGAIDLDYSSAGHVLAYHLSPAGQALLGKSDWPQALTETAPGRLVIQPNFEMLALPPVRETTLLFLDQIAEREALDQVARYRLTREQWVRALQAGASAATLIERLEQQADMELPQNMRYSLLEWERQAQRVRVYRSVALLEVEDEALLDTWLADPDLAPFILHRLTATAALVDKQRLKQFFSALLEHGQLPRFSTNQEGQRIAD
jgi:hypothetical protein